MDLAIFLTQSPSNPPPDFPLPLIIFIIVLGALTIVLLTYIAYKRIFSQRKAKLEKFLKRCEDISKINNIIVIDTKSGVDIYSQSFSGRKLDTSLISRFLQAIRNSGLNISDAAEKSRTLIIEYKDSIVMQTDFVNLKLIITLKEQPSSNFKFIMEDLAYDIYKEYGQEIEKFTGILKPFRNMGDLIEKHLNVSFLRPLLIDENPEKRLNESEKVLMEKARKFLNKNDFNYFYSYYLASRNKFKGDDNDGDDFENFPYPYIFKPPKPPDDLAGAGQAQLRNPPKDIDSKDKFYCQYCGMRLTKEGQFNHICRKKPL